MALSLKDISQGATSTPPRMIVYGVEGIGKTSLAAAAPDAIFIQTEDGLGVIDVPHFPLAKTYEDVIEAMSSLATEDHKYKTLVVDSLDWLENLVWQHTLTKHPTNEKGHAVNHIDDYGFGKGYGIALDYWLDFIKALNYLRDEKGMAVILVAHSEVKRFDDPSSEPYDRYQVKLHKGASAKVREWADCILFTNYRVATTQSDQGFGNKKTRAIGSGERLLYTEERPAFQAKNRYAMPADMPLAWDSLSNTIPFFNQKGIAE